MGEIKHRKNKWIGEFAKIFRVEEINRLRNTVAQLDVGLGVAEARWRGGFVSRLGSIRACGGFLVETRRTS
jgi:hypothetical protein